MKKVEYKGITYKITFIPYGYGDSRFTVNGEPTEFYLRNEQLTNLVVFKKYAKQAIEQYIAKHNAQEIFDNWDGKL